MASAAAYADSVAVLVEGGDRKHRDETKSSGRSNNLYLWCGGWRFFFLSTAPIIRDMNHTVPDSFLIALLTVRRIQLDSLANAPKGIDWDTSSKGGAGSTIHT